MKLLVLMPSFPAPTWGAGTRNYHFLKALATRHTVSLLCLVGSEEEASSNAFRVQHLTHTIRYVVRPAASRKRFQQVLSLARLKPYSLECNYSQEIQNIVDQLLAEEQYDAVLFESALMACYRLPDGMKCIIDQHNIEYDLLWRTFTQETHWARKWFNWWESRLLKPREMEICRKADLVLTTSERDRALLQEVLPQERIEVVPNGVDSAAFSGDVPEEASAQIIFTGAMNYYPNIEAALAFATQCWPLIKAEVPEIIWLIVGREPPSHIKDLQKLPGVVVTGTVPDVRSYLAASSVAIAPLHIGGGTRLKILEALAMKRAVVSTTVGCEGLEVVPGKHLLVVDRPAEFAQTVIALLRDSERRVALGSAGRALVEEKYRWEACGSQLLNALETHIQGREQVCR